MSTATPRTTVALLLGVAPGAIAQATNDLPALLPPYAELPPGFWEEHSIAVILGSIAVLAILGVTSWLSWLLLRPRPQPVIPPEVQARRELEALRTQPEDGQVLSRASQIVRRYVLAAFGLSAGELTTHELISIMESSPRLTVELRESIAEFLQRCDERKFAGSGGPLTGHGADRALELVNRGEALRTAQAVAPSKSRA